MPVIINEFEVVPQPATPVAETAGEQAAAATPDTLPQDVDSVLRLQYQRQARVRAD